MKNLNVKNFGPLLEANITLGDLTVLVGPQASGKSLFVQLLKAAYDAGAIRNDLKQYGFDWLHGKSPIADYCSLYFGGGLEGLVSEKTSLARDGHPLAFKSIAKPGGKARTERVYVVPAQRVLVLQDGWPKPFMGYAAGDPYCMRHFSDSLRTLMDKYFDADAKIFPHPKWLKAGLKKKVNESIYIGAKLTLVSEGMRKRVMLSPNESASALPYNAWSAGQREFTPLLLALYWLMPSAKLQQRDGLEIVVIEEPEMGLHPQAIVSFGLLVLELMARGYRVVISTHSPVILDLVWAISQLKEIPQKRATKALSAIFGTQSDAQVQRALTTALTKDYRTYYFERSPHGVTAKDISTLDPGDDDSDVSGWGGLSGFSGEIAEIVGKALTKERA